MPPTNVSSPSVKSADETCFSPLTGKRTPRAQIPPCKDCGLPSVAGRALAVDGFVFDVEFYCKDHGEPGEAMVSSRALYPAYAFVAVLSPGVYRIRRLERSEMLKRVMPPSAAR